MKIYQIKYACKHIRSNTDVKYYIKYNVNIFDQIDVKYIRSNTHVNILDKIQMEIDYIFY